MKILLVGGLGFIGKHLITGMSESHSLVVFSDREAALRNAPFTANQGVRVEIGDIVDGERFRNLAFHHKPQCVVHLAALTGIARCANDPSLAFSANVLGTYNVIMGCVACCSKLVFMSSREVYGESLSDSTSEEGPLLPNNIYGITKLLGERLVTWAASKYGLDYTILRLTNVYGPGGDQYGIQAMIKKALAEGSAQVFGGSQIMNLVYVEDVVDAIRRCLSDFRSSKQIFNVGSNDDAPIDGVVSRIASIVGVPLKVERLPMREGETLRFKPNLNKFEKMLGYQPTTPLADGLRKTVEWYREEMSNRS